MMVAVTGDNVGEDVPERWNALGAASTSELPARGDPRSGYERRRRPPAFVTERADEFRRIEPSE